MAETGFQTRMSGSKAYTLNHSAKLPLKTKWGLFILQSCEDQMA